MNESEYDNCLPSTSSNSPNISGVSETSFTQKTQLNIPLSLPTIRQGDCSILENESDSTLAHPQGPSTSNDLVSEQPLGDQYMHHPNYEPDPMNDGVLSTNFMNGIRTTCDRCSNMKANAQRALDSAIIMSRKIARFESMETENIQLQRQLGEANMYVEETLRKHHEQETELNAAKLEASKANKKLTDLDKQYHIIVEKAKEAKDHANAANVWREKYERTCVIMEIVQEKRVKAQQRLDHALEVAMKNKKMNEESSKQIENLEIQNKMLKDQHKAFRKYIPMLYEVIDSMIISTSRSDEYDSLSLKTRKAIDVVHRPETRSILLGDKVITRNGESQSDEEAARILEKEFIKDGGIVPIHSDDSAVESCVSVRGRGRGRGRGRSRGRGGIGRKISVPKNTLPIMDIAELEKRHAEAVANKLKKVDKSNYEVPQIGISTIHGKKGVTVREQQAAQMQATTVKERVAEMKKAIKTIKHANDSADKFEDVENVSTDQFSSINSSVEFHTPVSLSPLSLTVTKNVQKSSDTIDIAEDKKHRNEHPRLSSNMEFVFQSESDERLNLEDKEEVNNATNDIASDEIRNSTYSENSAKTDLFQQILECNNDRKIESILPSEQAKDDMSRPDQMRPLNETTLEEDIDATVFTCNINNDENALEMQPIRTVNIGLGKDSKTDYIKNMCKSAKTIRALEHIQRLERELEPQLMDISKPRSLATSNETNSALEVTTANTMSSDIHQRSRGMFNAVEDGLLNTDKSEAVIPSIVSSKVERGHIDIAGEKEIKSIIEDAKMNLCSNKNKQVMQDDTSSLVGINGTNRPDNPDNQTTNLVDQEAPPSRVKSRTGPTAPKRRRMALSGESLVSNSNLGSFSDRLKVQGTCVAEKGFADNITECDDVESRLQIAVEIDQETSISCKPADSLIVNEEIINSEDSSLPIPVVRNEGEYKVHYKDDTKELNSNDVVDNKSRRSSRILRPTAKIIDKDLTSQPGRSKRSLKRPSSTSDSVDKILTVRSLKSDKMKTAEEGDCEAVNSNKKSRRGRPRKNEGNANEQSSTNIIVPPSMRAVTDKRRSLRRINIDAQLIEEKLVDALTSTAMTVDMIECNLEEETKCLIAKMEPTVFGRIVAECSQKLHSGDMWNVVKAIYCSKKISDCIHNKEEEKLMNVANALSGGGFWVPFVNELILFMCRQSVIDPAQCGRNIRLIGHALEFMGDELSPKEKRNLVCSLMRMLLMEHMNVAVRALMFLLLSRAHSFLDWLIEDENGYESRLLALHFHSQQDVAAMVRWAWSERYSRPLLITPVTATLVMSWWKDSIVQIDNLSGSKDGIVYHEDTLLVNDDLRSLVKLCNIYLSPKFVIEIDRAEIVGNLISSSIQEITIAIPLSDDESPKHGISPDTMFADLSKSVHGGLSRADAARLAARVYLIIELLSSFMADGDHILRTKISKSIAIYVTEIRNIHGRLSNLSDNNEWIPITKIALSDFLRVIQVLTSHLL